MDRLLSLCGFYTINLGSKIVLANGKEKKFDVLKNSNSFPFGRSDIIAYEDNKRILLIDCDIGVPDNKKIDALLETSHYFIRENLIVGFEFLPVLFSPKDCNLELKGKRLGIVDKPVIENILEDLAKGNRENARKRIKAANEGFIES